MRHSFPIVEWIMIRAMFKLTCFAWHLNIAFVNLQLLSEKRVVPRCAPYTDRAKMHRTDRPTQLRHPPKIDARADTRRGALTWVRFLLRLGTPSPEQTSLGRLQEKQSKTDDVAAAIDASLDRNEWNLTSTATASWSLCSKTHILRRCLLRTWQSRLSCHWVHTPKFVTLF